MSARPPQWQPRPLLQDAQQVIQFPQIPGCRCVHLQPFSFDYRNLPIFKREMGTLFAPETRPADTKSPQAASHLFKHGARSACARAVAIALLLIVLPQSIWVVK